jgi:putative SOS response-associated peptidase YedK
MCGRLNIYDPESINIFLQELGLPGYPLEPPQYNVPPQTLLPIITTPITLLQGQWGIEFGKFRHPNSRAATIKRKPHLQDLLMHQRCIVPANRFYEWPDPRARPAFAGIKTRFCIHTPEDVLLLAGIYKRNPEKQLYQFNIITTDPVPAINTFHHRMPVILDPDQAHTWLEVDDKQTLYDMLVPTQQELIIYECDPWVDNARHQGPQCMAPLQH